MRALTVLLVAGLGAVGTVDAEATSRLMSLSPCTFDGPGQHVEAECGWLPVPETHFAPTDTEIQLPFVRFKSTSSNPATTVIYLAGGPGGSGIGTAKSQRFHLFMKLREVGDVIVFDQRGTGNAKPAVSCPVEWTMPLDQPADFDAWTPQVEAGFSECAAYLRENGITIGHYNTVESAADIDALRRALNLEKVSLWGTSYGTHLAFAAIRYHGAHLDRVIVSGPEGPDHTLKLPSYVQTALENLSDEIASRPDYAAKIPDLMDLIRRNLERLDREPVAVNFRNTGMTIGRQDLATFIAESAGRRRTLYALPRTLLEMDAGDYRRLAPVAYSLRAGEMNLAMSYAMDCASGASAQRMERIRLEDETTLIGSAQNFPFDRACSALGVPDLGEAFRGPLSSDVPVLFIAGTLDARTPVSNAVDLRPGFPNSYLVVVENAGHDEELFSLAPGLDERMVTFLRGGEPSQQRIVYDELEFAPLP